MAVQATRTAEEQAAEAKPTGLGERAVVVSQLTHEVNNQLSTLVNAIYLLRSEPISATASDLLDAAEGAIIRLAHLSKKIEEQAK